MVALIVCCDADTFFVVALQRMTVDNADAERRRRDRRRPVMWC
jgi:hypothetical protein